MVVTGELIRMMNYIDDIAATLRRRSSSEMHDSAPGSRLHASRPCAFALPATSRAEPIMASAVRDPIRLLVDRRSWFGKRPHREFSKAAPRPGTNQTR